MLARRLGQVPMRKCLGKAFGGSDSMASDPWLLSSFDPGRLGRISSGRQVYAWVGGSVGTVSPLVTCDNGGVVDVVVVEEKKRKDG